MLEEEDLELINLLHPSLRPYVKALLNHEFGLLKQSPKVHSLHSGAIVEKNQVQYADRFHVKIFYCKKQLNWLVLMNGNDIQKSPDFIMEDNFLNGITENILKSKVPSLANWCPSDVNCLLNVFLELLQLYKNYQVNLLIQNPSLQRYLFEYDTLTSMLKMDPNDVEVCVHNTTRTVTVIFLINLNIDFSTLPTALPNSKNLTVLVVEFKDNIKNTIQILLRIELESAFGNLVDIPDLPPDLSLMDYVPVVEEMFQKKVEKVIDSIKQRKIVYSYLVQFFEPALINGDNIDFTGVSFLLEMDNFYCVLKIQIPLKYPESSPTLQLLSLYENSRAFDCNGYTHNRSMTHEEIARSIYVFVKDSAIVDFKKSISK